MKTEKMTSQENNNAIVDIITDADYCRAKAKLDSLRRKRSWKVLLLFFLFFAFIATFGVFILFFDVYPLNLKAILVSAVFGSLIAIFLVIYFLLGIEISESNIRSKINLYEAENIKKDVAEDIFENSIRMSYKYLDQYYLQTKEQAQKGFLATVLVAGFGAFLIFGGIIAMYFGKAEPSYITCGAGVITKFISAVFFYLYNRTAASMSTYHNKLVLSHNISIALKVAESLPADNQIQTKNQIVSELLKDINLHMTKEDFTESGKK